VLFRSTLRTLYRQIRLRPRLLLSASIWLLALLLLPGNALDPARALVAWDLGAGLYLALAWTLMLRASVGAMRLRASQQDDGAAIVLALTVAAPIGSLAAIVLELVGIRNLPPRQQVLHLVLVGVTVVCSWFLVHTAFALHYAHRFYARASPEAGPCLQFPGVEQPDYVDFLYFSFVIGTTSQTADVSIASSGMRRLALVHGVIAFFFNTTVLALTINIAAGLT
jgi:uncharacterized membrane protein